MNQLDINSYPVLLGEEYKMRKSWLKKGLVCGIILLFVGTSFIPSISGNFVEIIKKDLNSPKTLHLTGDLICYWKFDEGNGSIAHDSSGNGYDGNIYGATWTTGKYGSGLEITGTSYVADIPFSYDDSITNAFTIAAWVKWYGPSSYPHDSIIFDGRGGTPLGFSFHIGRDTGKLTFHLNQDQDIHSISSIPIESWTHVAAVFDGSSNVYRLYINGNLDNMVTTTNTYYKSDDSPVIGNNHWLDGNWAPCNGVLDEIRIYNRALNDNEIQRLASGVNHNPNTPSVPSGQTKGKVGQEYSYTTNTTDLDGDQVYYLWDWGDGNSSGWLGPYNSGLTAGAAYNWTVKGSYNIKVKAKDTLGAESPWSDPLPITMPYSFNKPLLQFLELLFQRFPHAFPILRHLLGY